MIDATMASMSITPIFVEICRLYVLIALLFGIERWLATTARRVVMR